MEFSEKNRYAVDAVFRERCALAARKHLVNLREWFLDLKSSLKCESCAEDHPACLEFHHNDPAEKENHVSVMVHNGSQWK